MRAWFPPHRSLTTLASLALASALWGMPPQEGRTPHPAPQMPVESSVQGGPAPQGPVPSSRLEPGSGPTRHSMGVVHPRVSRVYIYRNSRTVVPPGWPRCAALPTPAYWGQRDIMGEIQWLSRTGFIPVSPLGDSVEALSDYAQFVDKWGVPGPGMLQAALAHQPVLVTYKNPAKEAQAVYVIVDDPGWWSDAKNPYALLIRRDWDPARTDLSQVKMVAGLWGTTPSVSADFRGPSQSGPAVFPH